MVRTAPRWPRFFFQRLQTTTVRLVLLPKAGNNPDDVLTISSEMGHMVQVMGVVQQHSRRDPSELSRRISMVEVELMVTELPASLHGTRPSVSQFAVAAHDRDEQAVVFYSKRSAPLQRDYFHCDFCVHFPGHTQSNVKNGAVATDKLYALRASAVLVDDIGAQWRLTGVSGAPDEVTLVRVECARTGTSALSSTSNGPATTEAFHQPPLRPVAGSNTTKVDLNRTALDSQYSLTKPRPIGRPIGEAMTGKTATSSKIGSAQ